MADTITSLADARVSEVLSAEYEQLVGPRGPGGLFFQSAPLIYVGDCVGQPSMTTKTPLIGLEGYTRLAPRAETIAGLATPLPLDEVTVTRGAFYKRYDFSQEAISTDPYEILANAPTMARDAALSRNHTIFHEVGELAPSATDIVGVSGQALALAHLLLGQKKLRAAGNKGVIAVMLHPEHWYNVQNDIQSQAGTVFSRLPESADQVALQDDAFQGMIGKMMIFLNEELPTSGPDTFGLMFSYGGVAWGDCTVRPGPAAIGASIGPMWLGFSRVEAQGIDGTHFHDNLGFSIAQQSACVRVRAAT